MVMADYQKKTKSKRGPWGEKRLRTTALNDV